MRMFKANSRIDWLEKVEKELKGKLAIADLSFEIDGIELSPFHHIDEFEVREPLFRKEMTKSGVYLRNGGDNKLLIKFLELGATCVKINTDDNTNGLDDISFDWIHTFLTGSKSNVDSFIHKHGLKTNRFDIIHETEGKSKLVVDLENNAIEQLRKIVGECPAEIIFECRLGENLYKNVAVLRAIRIIVANLEEINEKSISYTITVDLKSLEQEADKESKILEYSYKLMSAYMGGADFVFQEISEDDFDRTAFHLQNLITLESKMNEVQDPLNGSKFIEYLTDQYVIGVLEEL